MPLLVFWGLMFLWLFPWSAFLLQSLAQVPHRWRQIRGAMDRRQRAMLLFAIWAAVILLFFSLSTRQEYYVIPALPALALMIGGWLQQEADSPEGSGLRRSGRIGSVVAGRDRRRGLRGGNVSAGAEHKHAVPTAISPTC